MPMVKSSIVALVLTLLTIFSVSQAADDVAGDGVQFAKERLTKMSPLAMVKSGDSIIERLRQGHQKELRIAQCRIVKVCCYIGCCRWGPPGNGGTAVCLDQCCKTWCDELRC